jgi:hypothetical protein
MYLTLMHGRAFLPIPSQYVAICDVIAFANPLVVFKHEDTLESGNPRSENGNLNAMLLQKLVGSGRRYRVR